MSDKPYLIWSNEHRGWWKAGSAGYTPHLHQAGRYPRATAIGICQRALFGSRSGIPNEIPVLEADALEGCIIRLNK